MPKVSIIIPIHNPGKYLIPLLESLINQSFQDIEILAIDDGSTDGSRDILNEYAEKDNRIKLFFRTPKLTEHFQEKYSVDLGRNEANGEYIMFIDHDDRLPLNAIEILYSYTFNGLIDIVQGRNVSYDENNKLIYSTPNLYPQPTLIINSQLDDYSRRIHLCYTPVALWCCLIKKEIQKNLELGDYIFNDTDFIWKLKLSANTFVYIPEYVYINNDRQMSTSHTYDLNNHGLDIFQSYANLEKFFKENNINYWDLFSLYNFNTLYSYSRTKRFSDEFKRVYMNEFKKEVSRNVDIKHFIENDENKLKIYKELKKI